MEHGRKTRIIGACGSFSLRTSKYYLDIFEKQLTHFWVIYFIFFTCRHLVQHVVIWAVVPMFVDVKWMLYVQYDHKEFNHHHHVWSALKYPVLKNSVQLVMFAHAVTVLYHQHTCQNNDAIHANNVSNKYESVYDAKHFQ